MNPRCRRKSAAALAGAILVATVAAPPMASGAMTSTLGGIRLNTAPRPTTVSTPEALDALAACPVTWQDGETVTATEPDSSVRTLVDNAPSAGLVVYSPRTVGSWSLANSNGGSWSFSITAAAFVGVSSQPSGAIAMDTVGQGPDRAAKAGQTPPVAYSGDDWRGNASAASTLTFTPPMGAATTQNLSGTGATAFQFRQPGAWTVQLAMASGSPLSAIINIEGIPTRLNFR